MKKGFTLAEVLIVVAILGILAAIAMPTFMGQVTEAKEATAKDNLRILRSAIELYATKHDGVPPGYLNDNPTMTPNIRTFYIQMIGTGKYLSAFPKNPFSDRTEMKMVYNSEDFPTEPLMTDLWGWIYQPATKTIKLNWPGADSKGTPYFNY